jgi:NTP pyrophosphatase (non-canonical NTP hydrolase)
MTTELTLRWYDTCARSTAIYPTDKAITYPLLGLIGEVGEFANKFKKVLRDGAEFTQEDMLAELGDVLWYVSNLAQDAGLSLNDVAEHNIKKLLDRQNRGVLGGAGDTR